MRMFFQEENESIVINDEVTVTVLEIRGDEVILGIEAPEWVHIGEELESEQAAAVVRPR